MGEQQKKQTTLQPAKQAADLDYKDVENGPLTEANRQCRDIFCCLLFIVNIIWMIYATAVAYNDGNPSNIFRAVISASITCGGKDSVAKDYPYIYFSNPMDMQAMRYCVNSCPTFDSSGSIPATWSVYGTGGPLSLSFDSRVDSSGAATPAAYTAADDVGYDSSVAIDRVCIPSTTVFKGAFSSYTSQFSALTQGELANFILDIKNNWQYLLAAFGFAILISFVFMYALKCLAGCIIWLSVIAIILGFALLGLIFLYNAGVIKGFGDYAGYMSIPSDNAASGYYNIFGYISFGFSGLALIITLCCCSRLRLAVAVCKAAGQFVSGVCTSILVPIIQSLISLGLWGACLTVMVFLISTASFYIYQSSDYFTSVKYNDGGLINFYIFLFSTLWCNAVIQAIGIFVIASACAMWYYAHGPGQQLEMPILRSYKMVFRYHFGSLALGSFLLALVQFLQIMLEIFKKQIEGAGGENKCTKCLINCMRCCLACVERIVQFINKTAYIQIAIRGKNFCMAAKDGFQMVFSNALRYAIVSGVGSILMFIGKLLISITVTGLFYLLILYSPDVRKNILQPIYLLIIVFIMSFAVSLLFMAVYTLAMDTLLACFIVDESNSKGKGGKPQFAPQELAELMETD